MPIDLGLLRLTQLLSHLGNPHLNLKVLHIAGTNGKGSVCSYLNSVLQQSTYKIGKFTSPHLCHVRDSITVNQVPISSHDFTTIKAQLEQLDKRYSLKCTEFELMTATALSYFNQVKCSWCILEVGLGGRLDATNVIPGKNKVCGITKIGLDHESFLGNDFPSIAAEKAGILVEGTPFVAVDGTNDDAVIRVFEDKARSVGAEIVKTNPDTSIKSVVTSSWGRIDLSELPLNGEYQVTNVQVAIQILDYMQRTGMIQLDSKQVLDGIQTAEWPGRLQFINYHYSTRKTTPVLFDGAHNGSAAVELAKYLDTEFRFSKDEPLTFVIAITNGKTLEPLLSPIIRPQDKVICTEFGSVEGMPWIKPMNAYDLASQVGHFTKNVEVNRDLFDILPALAQSGPETKVVVCGSLYLVGQLLNVHYDNVR
ncbi:Fol3/Rma1 [Kluyveromyces lactis]|nr:Fol3/Rma1 [Kluyveromyces lactis]